jgi:O-antigen/teichoic acid export membrane protein
MRAFGAKLDGSSVTPTSVPQKPPRLAVQAFWLTASKIIGALINIALPIFLVRVLSQADYGVYRQVFMFSATAVSLSTLGVGMSAFYYIPRCPERGGQISLNILLYNVIVGSIPLLLLVLYPGVLGDLFRMPELERYAVPLGTIILLTLPSTFLQQIPTALQDVRNSTLMIVGTQFSRAVILMATVLFFPSVPALVIASIIHQFLQFAVMIWYLHHRFGRFWTQFEWAFFREQIWYALSIGIFGMVSVLQRDIHNYFVSASFGPADFAIYAVGCLNAPLVPIFLESVATVMVVRVSALQHEGRHHDVLRLTASAVNRLAAFQFPVAALLFVTGRDLIVQMYTKAYEPSAKIFAVNILLLPMAVLLVDPIVRAYTELRRYIMVVRLSIFIALIVTLYFAIQQLGMVGAIVASVVAAFIERVALAWRASKVLGASAKDLRLFADCGKAAALSIGAATVAYFIRNTMSADVVILRLIVTAASFVSIYLIGMYLLRLPGSEELRKDRLISLARRAAAQVKGPSR